MLQYKKSPLVVGVCLFGLSLSQPGIAVSGAYLGKVLLIATIVWMLLGQGLTNLEASVKMLDHRGQVSESPTHISERVASLGQETSGLEVVRICSRPHFAQSQRLQKLRAGST